LLIDPPVRGWLEAQTRKRSVRLAARWGPRLLLLAPLVWLEVVIIRTTSPASLPPIPYGATAARFGVPEAERRAIWLELTKHEPQWRQEAARKFPGDAWSQQDDYSSYVVHHVLELASAHRLHYSVVYMILDEGIRRHWPGPDGKPLVAVPVPLRPRIQ
jgi:hypothetical protein